MKALLILLLTAFAATAQPVMIGGTLAGAFPISNLVYCSPLNGYSVYDLAGNINTQYGGNTPTNSPYGGALQFTTNQYVQVGASINAKLTGKNAASITFWAYMTLTNGLVVGFGPTNGANGNRFCLAINNGSAQSYFIEENTGSASSYPTFVNPTNQWCFYVGTFNGALSGLSMLAVYTNAVAAALTTGGGTPNSPLSSSLATCIIGNSAGERGASTVRDVRFYAKTLSQQEIKQLYNAGPTYPP
jgi:hypothetical protein